LPSVPVMPTTPSSRLGRRTHAPLWPSARRASSTTSCARSAREPAARRSPPRRPGLRQRSRSRGRPNALPARHDTAPRGRGANRKSGRPRGAAPNSGSDGRSRPRVAEPAAPCEAGPSSSRSISSPSRRFEDGSAAASKLGHRRGRGRVRRRVGCGVAGGHSPASSTWACGRPRTLRMPWRQAPMRSCIACAAVEGEPPGRVEDQVPGPYVVDSRDRQSRP